MELLSLPFMQRALVAAALVGLAAPSIGSYLVQRRQALLGDGIGHVALLGVAVGLWLHTQPVVTSVVVATAGALLIEAVRAKGKAGGDVALAMLFYGGIAGGVLVIGLNPEGNAATLVSYLFGSLTTVAPADLWLIAGLSVAVLGVTVGGRRLLFAVCQDEEAARVSGVPVTAVNAAIAVTAAVTVTVGMRVVGVLMVSALMVVPVATAQLLTRSFAGLLRVSVALGLLWSVAGLTASFYGDVAPGAAIVVLAIAGFAVATAVSGLVARRRPPLDDHALELL